MTQLVLSDEQARIVSSAGEEIEIVDEQGRHLGYISTGFSPEEIAEAERRARSDGPWYMTTEVLDHLNSLEIP